MAEHLHFSYATSENELYFAHEDDDISLPLTDDDEPVKVTIRVNVEEDDGDLLLYDASSSEEEEDDGELDVASFNEDEREFVHGGPPSPRKSDVFTLSYSDSDDDSFFIDFPGLKKLL